MSSNGQSRHTSSGGSRSTLPPILPPIRDILGDELTNSAGSASRARNESFSLGPLRRALDGVDAYPPHSQSPGRAHDPVYASRMRTPAPRDDPRLYRSSGESGSASSRSHQQSMPMAYSQSHSGAETDPRRQALSSHERAVAAGNRSSGISERARTPTLVQDVDWGRPNRHASESSRYHRMERSASSHSHGMPAPNELQFRSLPYSSVSRHPQGISGPALAEAGAPTDYQSPFGVLVSDVEMPAGAHVGAHQTSFSQSSFPANPDFNRGPLESARYECPYCHKRFSRPSSLRIHENSHTGEKPFQCTFPGCGRYFSVQSNMRRHMRIHEPGSSKKEDDSDVDDDFED